MRINIFLIPAHNDGGQISVDMNGLIDKRYNFLFFESKQPDIWQYSEGWIVTKSELKEPVIDPPFSRENFFVTE